MKIDNVDLNILSELQRDSRLSMRELSKRVNLSTPSVTERVKRLEENGINKGYSIDIDYSSLGFSISCIIKITIKNGNYQKFQDLVNSIPEAFQVFGLVGMHVILSCYMLSLYPSLRIL